jgi:outer membrane protein assembly factor BamB
VVGDKLFIGLGVAPDLGTPTKLSYVVCLDVSKKGDVSFKSYDIKDGANKTSALVWAFGGPLDKPAPGGRKSAFGTTLSTVAVQDGLVYITEETGYLHCLDAKTGQQYWEHDFKENIWGSPYWADGKVYVATDAGSVVVFEHGKTCKYYIDGVAKAASRENERKLPSAELGEGTHSTPVVANGVLYIASKSRLFAIANGK